MIAAELEAQVLGAALIVPKGYHLIADLLTPDDFRADGHRVLWQAIEAMARKGEDTDAVTVADTRPEVARLAMSLANSAHGGSNLRAYAEALAKRSERLRVIAAAQRIAGSDMDAAAAIATLGACQRPLPGELRTAKALLRESYEALTARYEAQETITGLPTGVTRLDEITAGLQPGNLVVLAGRPGMGKTSMAMQIAINAAHRKPVAVFELEMTGRELMDRALAHVGEVPFDRIRKPKMADDGDWARITDAAATLSALPLLVDDASGQTVEAIIARARQAHAKAPLGLLVIDHLGLMVRPGRDSAANEVGEITRQLKGLAKSLGIPVLLCVQLNRAAEGRGDKRPGLGDLRDSGRIEEDADLVLMLYRDSYYDPESPIAGKAELLIRKHRNGPCETVWLGDRLDVMRFTDAEAPEHRPTVKTRGFGASTFRSGA